MFGAGASHRRRPRIILILRRVRRLAHILDFRKWISPAASDVEQAGPGIEVVWLAAQVAAHHLPTASPGLMDMSIPLSIPLTIGSYPGTNQIHYGLSHPCMPRILRLRFMPSQREHQRWNFKWQIKNL